ncbi:MAG: GNAT family N-acetyltransferase [Anaerolineae bacterium]|nr:GNAT family N-acetyltransferase [Anaerolineae bacterium]
MIELKPTEFEAARPLFRELAEMHLFATAVLHHDLPGRIYVDDVNRPRSGFMSTKELQFLAGDPDNDVFNAALKQIFQATVFVGNAPEATLEEIDLTFVGDSWLHRLETLFGDWRWPPIPDQAYHYLCQKQRLNWREMVPAGYVVRPLDTAVSTNQPADAYEFEVKPLADFGERDFGFCALWDGEAASGRVVCVCSTDVISGAACEIGIETHPDHMRKRLATVVAAATVEYALAHGFRDIWWICADDNHASIGTAEKVGFEKQFESKGYFFILDEEKHKSQVTDERR